VKILVTFALENEFAPWRKLAGFQCVAATDADRCYRAQIGDAEVKVVITGMGKFAAQQAMRVAFEEVPDFCITSGLAGALKAEYGAGDVLVARQVSEIKSGRALLSDDELVRLASESGAKVVERFLVSEKVITTVEEKQRLGASGDAVEMEGAYVLAAAARKGIRSVAIRSVSDTVDRDLPLDFDRVMDERGRVSIRKVAGQVVSRPSRIGGLIRLAHDSERAAGKLADFLDDFVRAIPTAPWETAKADAVAI
jgi:nucleoside phosphorylase